MRDLGLAEDVEDVIGPDGLPVPGPDVHPDQDVAPEDRGPAAGLSGTTDST